MRLPENFWKKTLAKLGLLRTRRRHLASVEPRRAQLEDLEARQLLAVIMDDGDLGFSSTGWYSKANDSRYYGDDCRYESPSSPDGPAAWSFTGLQDGGTYFVAATWIAHANRANDAPYTVRFADQTTVDFEVNQRVDPSDFSEGGSWWEELGGVTLPTGTNSLTVELAPTGSGYVIADAIRLEQLTGPRMEVSHTDATPFDGTLDFGEVFPNHPVRRELTIHNSGVAPLNINTSLTTLPDGFSFSETPPATVPAGQSVAVGITLDASTPGTYSGDITIGTDDPSHNEYTFTVTGTASDRLIFDNDDGPEFTHGDFTLYSYAPHYLNDTRYHSSSSSGDPAQWQISDLLPGGAYAISATWIADTNRSNNSPFTFIDTQTGVTLAEVEVN